MGCVAKFLQTNLNHSAGAQDLLLQSMAEWEIDVAIAAEPYLVPDRPYWAGDRCGSVAIVSGSGSAPLTVKERGAGYVAATWGGYAVIAVYFSPNRTLADLESFLNTLGPVVGRMAPLPVILGGDFNAKSPSWGATARNPRGDAVEEWAVMSGLSLLNRGTAHTCVRQWGGSVVDITFATAAVARRVNVWRVMEEVETLSDHKYIWFEVSATPGAPLPRPGGNTVFPRWAVGRLDRESAEEAAIVQGWLSPTPADEGVDVSAARFRVALTRVCDAGMPRARGRPGRRAVYWWSREIADLRAACSAARRPYTRARRRRARDTAAENQLYEAYREAKRSLQLAISKAKEEGWVEQLGSLDRDPWGRPYRSARNNFRGRTPPVTETLLPDLLNRVVDTLFPAPPSLVPPPMPPPRGARVLEPDTIPPVSDGEMERVVERLRTKRRAPGPDGVPGRVLALALEHLGEELRALYDRCLRSGQFPKLWKEGRLCLIRKVSRPPDCASAYRPIVLLDDTAKSFERIVASRVVQHITVVGPDLSAEQYGFRAGRSTTDALVALKALSTETVGSGEGLLALSLDIANAFNSMPWVVIREALRYFGVPPYLRHVLDAYLSDRTVVFVDGSGRAVRRRVECGVPQGSVLGPILWNLGYDWVLRGALLRGMRVLCYADDTLVVCRGRGWREVERLATVGVALVVRRIRMLGLRVAVEKTEALMFHGPRRGPPPGAHILMEGVRITVGAQMKYLGLNLDGRWGFEGHFRAIAPKIVGAAGALVRLLPNTGGPGASCRRLYAGVVRSMALYGAPVWVDALSRRNKAVLRRLQRTVALRAIRGYHTVSWGAACALSGSPPWELEAGVLAAVYQYTAAKKATGQHPAPDMVGRIRRVARRGLMRRWAEDMADLPYGRRTIAAVQPVLRRWSQRKEGSLTFRLVQILTGHGCFGHYLHQICGREPTTVCHECGAADDTAQHTLEVCGAWSRERRALTSVVGGDLSLPSVIVAMLDSDRCWDAVVSFCETVMSQKEAAERLREDDPLADPLRRRRTGVRRRRFAQIAAPP